MLAAVLRRDCWFHALVVLVFIYNGVSLRFSNLQICISNSVKEVLELKLKLGSCNTAGACFSV